MNDAAAVTAVRQWKFSPALYNGQPIAVVQLVQVRKTVN
jgi:outer membrane biosynthesis protein TonB